jgi:hypothetical protein
MQMMLEYIQKQQTEPKSQNQSSHDKFLYLPYSRMRRTTEMALKTGGGWFSERLERPPKLVEFVQNGPNDLQIGRGSFLRTAITTVKTGRGRFSELPERPPKRAGPFRRMTILTAETSWAVLQNAQNDRQNGLGPFRRTPRMTAETGQDSFVERQ